MPALLDLVPPPRSLDLPALDRELQSLSASEIVSWSAATFGEGLVLGTSFGIQSALMLHLVTRVVPDVPVVWVDTGYLPSETYRFAEDLRARLDLNLHIYQSPLTPARMEALHGRLWERDDVEALDRYDRIRKVEPMQRALDELGATAWLSGLRAEQTEHRRSLPTISRKGERFKVLPVLGWSSADVRSYLREHDLPLHPLSRQGYASVGDAHSSRALEAHDSHERDTRFRGLKQECGLHL